MGKETDFILLQTKSTCWNSMVTRHVLYLVLQFGWKMLQSLKSKFVKHLPKILKSQSTTHIKQIKCYYMYTHKCIQKHTYTQHVSGHLTVVMTTDHILIGLKGSMVVRVQPPCTHSRYKKSTKPMGRLHIEFNRISDLAVPTPRQYFMTDSNYFTIPCFHSTWTH